MLYTFAPDYTNNNAILVDAANAATLTLSAPSNYSALSFLTASANGPATIDYVINYSGGTTQKGQFVSMAWSSNTPAAFVANGRVNVGNGTLSAVETGNPRLYSAEVVLTDTASSITGINLSLDPASPGVHAVVFAVSGTAGTASAPRPVLSITAKNGTLTITTTQPGELQSISALGGTNTVWQNVGSISNSVTVTPAGRANFYRVLAQ
jgi:hypothetical protein